MQPKLTIAIPVHNGEKTLEETIQSALTQSYGNFELLISENASTDNTLGICYKWKAKDPRIVLYTTSENIATTCFTKCMLLATGEYLIYLCADDLFTNPNTASEVVWRFHANPQLGHISRYYYQFLDGYDGIIRKNHSQNIYQLADNPSGLAFRKSAMCGEFVGKPFIEGASMVNNVIDAGWKYDIIKHDTIAVRVRTGTNSTMNPITYLNSPALNWISIVGKQDFVLKNYISFIQLNNFAPYKYLLREIWVFIKYRPRNLISFPFWFFALGTLLTPKCILRPLTRFVKHRLVRYFV